MSRNFLYNILEFETILFLNIIICCIFLIKYKNNEKIITLDKRLLVSFFCFILNFIIGGIPYYRLWSYLTEAQQLELTCVVIISSVSFIILFLFTIFYYYKKNKHK